MPRDQTKDLTIKIPRKLARLFQLYSQAKKITLAEAIESAIPFEKKKEMEQTCKQYVETLVKDTEY